MQLLKCFLLCAGVAIAQTSSTTSSSTTSAHNGWSFADTLGTMTDVIVADITAGGQSYSGANTVSNAKVRVVRVLQGDLVRGVELPLSWQLQSIGAPPAAAELPRVRALFFLRKQAATFVTLNAPSVGPAFYLELPQGPLPPGLIWLSEQHAQIKLSDEFAWALESFSARQGPAFDSLASALNGLDLKYSAGAYFYLAGQLDPNVRLIGLQGRIRTGDVSAIFEIEQDLQRLAATRQSPLGMGIPPIIGFDWSRNLPALHAVARIALSDTTLPRWEDDLPMMLGFSRSLEFLPYLRVMLDSPRPYTRDASMGSICTLLRGYPPQKSTPFWSPEMQPNCPTSSPMNDTAAEERGLAFWRTWYADHLDDLRKVASLAQVIAPTRYSTERRSVQQSMPVPIEVRFQTLVSMSTFAPDHVHDGSGDIVASSRPAHDPVSQDMPPADREIFRRIVEATQAKLDQLNKASTDLLSSLSQTGRRPELKQLQAFETQRQEALRAGLSDLRSQLSSASWAKVEDFMMNMNIHMGGMPLGGPPRQ